MWSLTTADAFGKLSKNIFPIIKKDGKDSGSDNLKQNDKISAESYDGEKHSDKILRTALDLAENLLKCGGTVHRAEETVERICKSHGATHVEVFSIPSLIIASLRMENGEYAMQTRRIYGNSNNYTRLDRLNAISRKLCAGEVTLDEAQQLILEAKSAESYPKHAKLIASMLISGAFAMFFGGTFLDAVISATVGLVIMIISLFLPKMLNPMATNLILSALAGFMAIIFTHFGLGDHYDKIIIGTIMLVIPGLSFGTSIRDLLCGDTLSGVLQLIQSVLTATIIAFGYTIALFCLGAWIA